MAKGGVTPKSDVDLAVSLGNSPERKVGSEAASARLALMNDVLGYLQTSQVDLVVLNHADSLLRFEIARTGKPVYEAAPGTFADFCSLAVRQHEDSKVFYEAMDRHLARTLGKGV
jgi:predicted nucleotidyltransferase